MFLPAWAEGLGAVQNRCDSRVRDMYQEAKLHYEEQGFCFSPIIYDEESIARAIKHQDLVISGCSQSLLSGSQRVPHLSLITTHSPRLRLPW